MVMLGWQDDGTIGPNINTSIIPAKPGSTAALARQANGGGIGAALAQQTLQKRVNNTQTSTQTTTQTQTRAAPATTIQPTTVAEQSNTGGPGANKSSARRGSRRTMGVASEAFAGNVGSVNTEVQNDDVLFPYQKGNL